MITCDPPNIPEISEIALSVRSFSAGVRDTLEQRIRGIAASIAEAHGASIDIDHERGYPVVTNSEGETAFATEVVTELVGEESVSVCPLIPAAKTSPTSSSTSPAVSCALATPRIRPFSTARNTISMTAT